jgi:hypothetical protein
MTTARALVEQLATVLPGRTTLLVHVESTEQVYNTYVELVKDGGADAKHTRPPHYKSNDGRSWLGADVRIGHTLVLIGGPPVEVPITIERKVG